MRTGAQAPARDVVRVTGLFVALTLLLAYPLSVHPAGTVLPLGGDTRLFLWTLGWDVHALTHRPWAVFDANIFAPERLTLAYSENCIGSALIAAPFLWIARNPILAMNAVVLVSCVLCGVGTYVLGRQLGLSRAGSVVAGIVFAFAPPRFLRLGQLHLATVQWVPFCLMYVDRYFSGGRPHDARLAAVFFAWQVLTSGHAALFLIVALACLATWRSIRREPLRIANLPRDLGVVGAACLAIVLLLMVPYMMVRHDQGWVRTLEESRIWSPNAASFLESPSHVHRLAQSVFHWQTRGARAALFPGILPLLLAPIGVWAVVRDRSVRARLGVYLVVAIVSVWLALGPDYGLYALMYKLPASNFIRVPSRYMTLTLLALAILAGGGFDGVSRRLSRGVQTALAVAVPVLLLVEFAVIPLGAVPYDASVPAADRWLAGRPAPFVVAEVPVVSARDEAMANSRQSIYMIHSTAHWQKTVHGYSGFEPPRHTAAYRELLQFPDPASLQRVQQLGVDYVVVHVSYYRPDEWSRVRERLAAYASRLALIYNDGESRVYALRKAGS